MASPHNPVGCSSIPDLEGDIVDRYPVTNRFLDVEGLTAVLVDLARTGFA